jgi:glycine cleavage system aminomethyltransferase T/glycine/D-amino acid oxidase-like deaminating enzyme
MSRLPERARVVIVGAGIAGNALAWHLSKLGWRDIVLLDKGRLPNPGGSTGHASSFTFPVDYSRLSTRWCVESIRQFTELGTFTQSGGIEVARSDERMEELRRRMSAARAWGVDAELITPAEVRALVPFIDERVLLGGFHTPMVGVVDPVRAGTLMREEAAGRGALVALGSTEVTAIDVTNGRVTGLRTTNGDIRTDLVVVACGSWSPRLGRMAGAAIPLAPIIHQMVSLGPVPAFAGLGGEIRYPVIRDMDPLMYERQSGADLEIGSYAHRTMIIDPDDIPSNEASALSPTELPFTPADFDPHVERALELFPSIVGDERIGMRYAINGVMSLTADGFQLLGETPEVRGLWAMAAMWIKEAPAIARTVARWMDTGTPDVDVAPADIARFHDHQRTRAHVWGRVTEAFPKFYGIVHPSEQWDSSRGVRLSSVHSRHEALGAVFFESAGWERPQWYASNEGLLEEYGHRVSHREAAWDARWWSPIIDAEHLALRDRVGLVDNPAFGVFDVVGRGAGDFLQGVAVADVDFAPGRLVYTQLLDDAGGIRTDLTITRLAGDHYRVVTAGSTAPADLTWLRRHLPEDGLVQIHDVTSAWGTLGLFGPRARDVLASVTRDDVSPAAFPYAAARWLEVGPVRALALRISYTGELGWELHVPMEQAPKLWDLLLDAGAAHRIVPFGIAAYGTTTRLEKGYRAVGAELNVEHDLVEAGLARPKVKSAPFIGKAAYLAQRSRPPAAILSTLSVDGTAASDGLRRHALGGEPVTFQDGRPLVDARDRRSYVTSAGRGPSVGRDLVMSYLPPDVARPGTKLAIEAFGQRLPVTVEVAGSVPLFDPENVRLRS